VGILNWIVYICVGYLAFEYILKPYGGMWIEDMVRNFFKGDYFFLFLQGLIGIGLAYVFLNAYMFVCAVVSTVLFAPVMRLLFPEETKLTDSWDGKIRIHSGEPKIEE